MSDFLAFLPLKIVLIAIDLTITLVTFGWVKALQKRLSPEPIVSVPVEDDPSHRVHPDYRGNLLKTFVPGAFTLYDLAKRSFESFPSRKCMGTRTFLGWKSAKVREFGDIIWKTYADVERDAYKFGAALRAAGVQPAPDSTDLKKVTSPCRIAIYENTCSEWMIAAIGAFTQSITVTTAYATLGIDALIETMNDNCVPVILCNKKSVAAIAKRQNEVPSLKCIVYTNDMVGPNEIIELPAPSGGLKIISFADFVASGDTSAFPPTPPKPTTCAVVMYTSGSTGKPKGVIITHESVVGGCAAGSFFLGSKASDVYLGYLPLAHILELMAEFVLMADGCTICYADPKSLTTTGAYPMGALEQFSPTLMAGVPKIWEVIKKGIMTKVAAGPKIAQFLVTTAIEWKIFAQKNGFNTPLFNVLVFKKFKQVVGGRLRLGISGGGPLNAGVQDFIRAAFDFEFVQGYGLTETCAAVSYQERHDLRGGVVGRPVPSAEVKLLSTNDVVDKAGQPYLSTDRRDVNGEPVYGRGEILVRGTNISTGYYMMDDKTEEVYEPSGWFHTGDIGQFLTDGSLRIVDRKKNLVKLKGGEYIAIEQMEMIYGQSKYVDAVAGGIVCYADGDMDRPVAILQISQPAAMAWAKENGKEGDFAAILKTKELSDAVLADCWKEFEASSLSRIEKIVAVLLVNDPWTPENGCLTAANKLQRKTIISKHEKEFDAVKAKGIF